MSTPASSFRYTQRCAENARCDDKKIRLIVQHQKSKAKVVGHNQTAKLALSW
jgi:hypothetical protein